MKQCIIWVDVSSEITILYISSKLTDYRSLSFCLSKHGFVCFKMDKFNCVDFLNFTTKINYRFQLSERNKERIESIYVKKKMKVFESDKRGI